MDKYEECKKAVASLERLLKEAQSVINQMRMDLREPLELRGTMEGAIRAAIFRADSYNRNIATKPASVRSAEELAESIIAAVQSKNGLESQALGEIMRMLYIDRSAQRQIGRDEV